MKRKLSFSTAADAQQRQHSYGNDSDFELKMSQPQPVADCKQLSINSLGTSDDSSNTPLVRQNAYDSGSSPTEDLLKTIGSPSVSSNTLDRCSVDLETECFAIIGSEVKNKTRNSDPTIPGYLDPQTILTSSVSNNLCQKRVDRVSYKFQQFWQKNFPCQYRSRNKNSILNV